MFIVKSEAVDKNGAYNSNTNITNLQCIPVSDNENSFGLMRKDYVSKYGTSLHNY